MISSILILVGVPFIIYTFIGINEKNNSSLENSKTQIEQADKQAFEKKEKIKITNENK